MTARRGGWTDGLAVYLDRRILAILVLGFSSGLPLLLTFSTLSVWLAEQGVSKTEIGLFALVGLPYSYKFLWAPVVDRLPLPWLTRALGRRRGWALATQIALVAAILAMGQGDPAADPWTVALLAVLVAFASASQDIVIDAYRVEILDEEQYGAGAATIVAGYRVGMLVAGAGALFLAEALPWSAVYACMAACVLPGMLTVLLMHEPVPPPTVPDRPGVAAWLRSAVVAPFADVMQRPGWVSLLVFVVLYKFGDSLAGIMANPFYLEMGFSKAEIASVSKLFGFAATLAGGFLGGVLVARAGLRGSLLIAGALQLLSNLMFAVQATVGHDIAMLALTIGFENVAGGMGTAAFVAFISRLCSVSYTATQYALLSALATLPRTLLSSSGGVLADHLSWVAFFVLTAAVALPGLWLAWRLRLPERTAAPAAPAQPSSR